MSDITFSATTRSADAPDIEADVYDATFLGVSKKFIKGGAYGDGERFEWRLALLDEDGAALYDNGDPVEVTGLTSMSTNILSKTEPRAVRYLRALMSAQEFASFKAGEGLSATSLVGRTVQAEVAIKDNGWPSVTNLLPPRKRRGAGVRQATRPVTEDLDDE